MHGSIYSKFKNSGTVGLERNNCGAGGGTSGYLSRWGGHWLGRVTRELSGGMWTVAMGLCTHVSTHWAECLRFVRFL